MSEAYKLSADGYGLTSPTFHYNHSSSDEYQVGDDGYGTSETDESSPERSERSGGELLKFKVRVEKRKRNQRQKERKALESHYFAQLKQILLKLNLATPKKGTRGITQNEVLQITRATIQKCVQLKKIHHNMLQEDRKQPSTS